MQTVYACYNKNENIRRNSSSGGIYYSLAKEIIKEGGCVYAACYDENLDVVHREINSENDILLSCGSKYVTSYLKDTFRKIKASLYEKKIVLFVGTPCQCAGLRCFLKDKTDNLICVDFVCHGIPGRVPWRKYKESLKKNGKDIKEINMRDKSSGWSYFQYSWKFTDSSGNVEYQKQQDNPFMQGFVRDYYLRPSCYECQFKGTDRGTDITLGDFWGIWEVMPEIDDNKGISFCMVNSEKGMDLFEKINLEVISYKINLDSVIKYNPSLVSSVELTYKRKKFYELQKKYDFNTAIEKLTKEKFLKKIYLRLKVIFRVK